MSDHSHESPEELARHVRKYILVFVALLIGTIVTVLLWTIHFESMALTIAIALFIATIKAFLVAGYFMHLISEKKMIYSILAVTVFFFVGLMGLTLFGIHDAPKGSEHKTSYVP
jgi:cytochrome c oxidase subunit 4